MYPLIPRLHRQPRRGPVRPAPDRPSPVVGMMIEGEAFHDQPPGGYAGASLPEAPPQPPAQPAQELVLEPPPWAGKEAEATLEQIADSPAKLPSALDAMKLHDEGFDPPAPGPPMVVHPAPALEIPAPNWELERQERAEQNPEPPAPEPGPVFVPPAPPWK